MHPKTITDIAKEAGVSIATVSRVLSKRPNVSKKTYDRVMAVVERHGYRPNAIASSLLQGKTNTVGVVTADLAHPDFITVLSAVEREANPAGYAVQVISTWGDAIYDEKIIEEMIARRMDAALLIGGYRMEEDAFFARQIAHLRRYMPVVIVGCGTEEMAAVGLIMDHAEGMRMAMRHLHRLGNERIALIDTELVTREGYERACGVAEEAARLGLSVQSLREKSATPAAGEMAILKLLAQRDRAEWPTALIVGDDRLTMGIYRQLDAMQLKIPGDIAVVGCGNYYFSAYMQPALTTLDFSYEEQAQTAASLLMQAVSQELSPFQKVIKPTLIIRSSCGAVSFPE